MIKKILFSILFLFFGSYCLGQGASCNTAFNASVGVTYTTGSVTDATINDPTVVACNGQTIQRDGWIRFKASTSAVNISVTTNNRNPILYAYSGVCGTLTNIGCANVTTTTNGHTETLSLAGLINGSSYFIRIGNSTNNNMIISSFLISPVITNNNCSGAIPLSVSPTETCSTLYCGITVGTSQSIPAINCGFTGNADDDVWYSFVATATAHDITVTPSSINDVVIDLRNGACNGANIDCADDTVGNNPEVINAIALTIGITYYVRVYSYGGTANQGAFDICVTTPGLCTPTTDDPAEEYITNVSFLGTLQDTSNTTTYSNGYDDYTGLTPISSQIEGEGVNVYVEGLYGGRIKAWIDWNNDGNFDNNPATELVYDSTIATFSTTFGFQIPFGTTPGDYRIRIRTFIGYDYDFWLGGYFSDYDFDACEDFYYDSGSDIELFGEAEDYLFNVQPRCVAEITSVIDGNTCGAGTVNLSANGTSTAYRWYASANLNDTTVLSTNNNYTTPSISSTTTYYVAAFDSSTSCESIRIPVVAKYNPVPTLTVTPDITNRIICGENAPLEISAVGDIDEEYLINEDFSSNLGVFSNQPLTGNTSNDPASLWQLENSVFIPSEQVWFPAISSGFGSDGFVMSNSDVGNITHQALQSTGVNTTDFNNLTLSMRMYYSHFTTDGTYPTYDYVSIEVSEDNGAWTSVTGNLTSNPALILDTPGGNIVGDVGIGTRFKTLTFNLSSHIDIANLRVRVRYYGNFSDGIALDDIKLFGDKDITTVNWSTTPANIIDLYIDTNSDNIGDTLYSGGTYSTVYATPSLTQLEEAQYDFTINATLANGCGLATLPFSITNNSKIWLGNVDDNWNNANNWRPVGIPDADNCVIVIDNGVDPDPQILGPPVPPTPSYAKNLTVKDGGYLELQSDTNLTVTDWVKVEPTGIFNLRNSASLVQIDDITSKPNLGNIHVQRAPKSDFSTVGNLDYVYWSSPVEAFNLGQISPNTSPNLIWQWIPTVSGNGTGNHGDWQNTNGTMTLGKGYIVRGLSGTPTVIPSTTIPVSNNTALFSGVPNNGEIGVTISRGNWTGGNYSGNGNIATNQDDNWNLLGNPYPSSISANEFVTMNTNISGTIYLWPHESLPDSNIDPFYANFVFNYDNNYIQHNPTGTIPPVVGDTYIASGQSFMTLMLDTADPNNTSQNKVYFNNSLRDGSQANNAFYRQNDGVTPSSSVEKSRIWLDLVSSDNIAHTLLVGYVENATNVFDRLYDGYNFVDSQINFYSLIEESTFSIQGRALPFLQEDTVPLGISISQNDIYKIGVNTLDGLFTDDSQNIFLEDTYLGIIHNLKSSPYTFSSNGGTFNNRFILRYINETLGTDNPLIEANLSIIGTKNLIKVTSGQNPINTVTVYDILGRELVTKKDINALDFTLNTDVSDGTYIVKATLYNGQQKIKKVVLKQ